MGDCAPAEPSSGAIAELIERYLGYLRRRGTGSTPGSYGSCLRQLRNWLAERDVVDVSQLAEHLLEQYQDSLLARGLQPKSRALQATAMRSWIRWLMDHEQADWRLLRAVTTVRVPRGRAHPIPPDDLGLVLEHLGPRRPQMRLRELRERALFFYTLTTGARIGEVLQVRRDAYVDTYVVQKGGEEKRLRIPPTVARIVEEYLAAREDNLPWLWVTNEIGRPPRRLTRSAANQGWRRMAQRLGISRWTSHRLRDSSATWLALQRLPTHLIADHLGHHGLATVQKYIQVADEQRSDVLGVMEQLAQSAPQTPRRWVKIRGRADRRPKR